MRKQSVFISTSVYNKTYLKKMWTDRANLAPYERRGFAQFFYLTISGHLEAFLAALIRARVDSIRNMIRWETLKPATLQRDGVVEYCSLKPVLDSLFSILNSTDNEAEQGSLEGLRKLFSRVFDQTLADRIGKELNHDIDALQKLRNLFAHGRDLYIELKGVEQPIGILDGNPLQLPAQRLQQAGVFNNFEITGTNYLEFQEHFYSDAALFYFYDKVNEIERALRASVNFTLDEIKLHLMPLPDLRAEQTDRAEQGKG